MIAPTAIVTPKIHAWLNPSVTRGGHSWAAIYKALLDGHAMIWVASEGCVLTQVDEDNHCEVLLGGGSNARNWIGAMNDTIRAHPAHADVVLYRIVGRKGWARLFPDWTCTQDDDGMIVLESAA